MALSFIEGNEATAWGALTAGCQFFAGYPITPATTIFNTMLAILPPAGGYVVQAEDEIAAMGYCIGASMAGLRCLTATSGPGISLYSEHISFAIGGEIPLVIVDVQRLGPTTGSATRGSDGDVQFLRWGNSSGLPIICLAPSNAAECFVLVQHAFDFSEKYRVPVMLASNKEIGMTKEALDLARLPRVPVSRRPKPPEDGPFLPFACPEGSEVPNFLPIGGQTIVRQTSSTHGPNGYLETDPKIIGAMIERMRSKVESQVDEISLYEHLPAEGADTLVVTYGVSARAARQAQREMIAEGKPVSLLVLQTLWPVPEGLLAAKAAEVDWVLVVEGNLGQYAREVRRVLCHKTVETLARMDSTLIEPAAIKEALDA